MTARRYALWLLAAFVTPGVVLYGGLFVIASFPHLSDLFGDQMFKALRQEASRGRI